MTLENAPVALCEISLSLIATEIKQKKKKKMAKKAAAAHKSAAAKKGGKKSHRKPRRSWNVYINRSLKSINKTLGISGKTIKIVNSFVNDVFDRIATEAATLARVNKKRTLGSREVQTAVRLVLPAELAKHAMAEGTKAIAKVSA
jgi:histone H2B